MPFHRAADRLIGWKNERPATRYDEEVWDATMADHQACLPAASSGVAEQAVCTALGVGPQPVGHVHGQHGPPVCSLRLGRSGQQPAQSTGIDPTAVEGVVQRVVPSAVFGQRCQVHGRRHGPVRAEQCVGQLERLVTVSGQTCVEVVPEVSRHSERHRSRPGLETQAEHVLYLLALLKWCGQSGQHDR